MLLITIDTNVLISGIDGEEPEKKVIFSALRDFERRGYLQLALTSRFDEDKNSDMNIERVKRHYRVARSFPSIGGPFRIGTSYIGGQDCLVGNDDPNFDIILGVTDTKTASSNTLADSDHLYAHWRAGYDYFLTYDRLVLKKWKALETVGVRVIAPGDFVKAMDLVITGNEGEAGDNNSTLRSRLDQILHRHQQ